MKQLDDLLLAAGKHGLYQMLPEQLISKYPQLKKYSHTDRIDNKRYNWFSSKLNFENKKVIDIGANIGYFSFRLNYEENTENYTYEPFQQHCIAINEIRNLLNISENKFIIKNEGVDFDNIDNLPKSDIVLLFNVVQHAGEDFDKKYVQNSEQWKIHVSKYLTKLSTKTRFMVFQTGYSWLGHKNVLCQDNEIIEFSEQLLNSGGFKIINCGMIKNIFNQKYIDIDLNKHRKIFLISKIKKFIADFLASKKIIKANYRFMQRPIFICESKNFNN